MVPRENLESTRCSDSYYNGHPFRTRKHSTTQCLLHFCNIHSIIAKRFNFWRYVTGLVLFVWYSELKAVHTCCLSECRHGNHFDDDCNFTELLMQNLFLSTWSSDSYYNGHPFRTRKHSTTQCLLHFCNIHSIIAKRFNFWRYVTGLVLFVWYSELKAVHTCCLSECRHGNHFDDDCNFTELLMQNLVLSTWSSSSTWTFIQ